MRLSDLFITSNNQSGSNTDKISADSAKTELLNRQIKALVPGQTISGEIVAKSGNEVQIRLADDMVITARLDQNINLEMGKGMSFEVKNNGSTLTLSPLFANTATDATVLKALDMASLPVSDTTIAMTQSMMRAGLSIDRGSLQQIFRELNTFPNASVENVVDLHRLGMMVTEGNLEQIASYKNMTYQLTEGMNAIFSGLPGEIESMIQDGAADKAAGLYQALLDMVDGLRGSEGAAGGRPESAGDVLAENAAASGVENTVMPEEEAAGKTAEPLEQSLTGTANAGNVVQQAETAAARALLDMAENLTAEAADGKISQTLTPKEQVQLANQLSALLEESGMPEEQKSFLQEQVNTLASGNMSDGETLTLVRSLLSQVQGQNQGQVYGNREALTALLGSRGLAELVNRALKDSWTLRPQDMKEPARLEELYGRLNRQLHSLNNALAEAGIENGNTARTVSNMTQNLDFMQQMNQMYTYVQLPLKMGQSTAHGELYVYSNKKHLASRDGKISALLHLDMEHLGPVDVYVAMQESRVNTHFYLADEEMLDFLLSHIDILNKRLQDRGYDMKCEMKVRDAGGEGEGSSQPVIQTILQDASPEGKMVQYAFDVRA